MSRKFKPTKFKGDRFTSTQFDPSETKARVLNRLTKFIADGFPEHTFFINKTLYVNLSQHFGHIAHTNQQGFWDHQFSSPALRIAFVEYHSQSNGFPNVGDPAHTWSDVCREFTSWLQVNHVLEELRAFYKIKPPQFDTRDFLIVDKSKNTGSFGHNQFIVIDRQGNGYKLQHIQSNGPWAVGDMISSLTRDGEPTWEGLSVEIPERIMKQCPEELVKKRWATYDATRGVKKETIKNA